MCVCVIQGLTECYECQPKPAQKSYPGCTIRNTPSEPIHCIVWAKHLFKYDDQCVATVLIIFCPRFLTNLVVSWYILILPDALPVTQPFSQQWQSSLHGLARMQWCRNWGFRRFNEPGPPKLLGPRVVGPQKKIRQDS